MFDLTREIILAPKDKKTYRLLQAALYLVAFLSALYLSYLIIFPHKVFSFSFSNPNFKNTNINPPVLDDQKTLEKGDLPAGQDLSLYTDIMSDYSIANVTLNTTDNQSTNPTFSVSIRRSYQAFMYPSDSPIGWRDGSLLKNGTDYYIVSDSKLRKFEDFKTLTALGYSDTNFQKAAPEDLLYNRKGDNLSPAESYPDDALFRIEDSYYILKGKSLQKFVSDQAYLSKYSPSQAISKNADFFNLYPASDELAGFADGTLLSNANSVFIVSEGQILPIDNPATFIDKGFSWNDVLAAGEDELAMYQKAKLFNITSPHPDGTIFKADDTDKYYMIEGGKKHLLPTAAIALSWLKKTPVAVSDKALDIRTDCTLKKSFWNDSTYACNLPLEKFSGLNGFSYELRIKSATAATLDSVSVDYKKNIAKSNFKSFLSGIYNSILTTYYPVQTNG